MLKFIKVLIFFSLIGFLLGEAVTRIFSLSVDAPKSFVDSNGLIKFIPNQRGNYLFGSHQWQVNRYGYMGCEPEGFSNLITLVGDSFIENIMNSLECHQCSYLTKEFPNYHFFEAARAGCDLLEYMEMTKQLDSLNPIVHIIYVNEKDIFESIREFGAQPNYMQINLYSDKIHYPRYQGSRLKDFIYNLKFPYMVYRKVLQSKKGMPQKQPVKSQKSIDLNLVDRLLEYIVSKYSIDNKIFILHGDFNSQMIELLQKYEFQIYKINGFDRDTWTFESDGHWNCYGHEQVASQVGDVIRKSMIVN